MNNNEGYIGVGKFRLMNYPAQDLNPKLLYVARGILRTMLHTIRIIRKLTH